MSMPSCCGDSGRHRYAPIDGSFLTVVAEPTLPNSRQFTPGVGITGVDGGAGGAYTITANLSTGIAGGQSCIGGTGAGEDLTLSSTTNAAKGSIFFGTSAYDEATNKLGLGMNAPVAYLDLTEPANASGSPIAFRITGGAHTTLAAGAEASDVSWLLARTVQFSTGAITNQRAFQITGPTYTFVGASTITNCATTYIESPQTGGANATFTYRHALWLSDLDATIMNATTDVLRIGRMNTTGTPAAGYGPAILFRGMDASLTAGGDDMARIASPWITSTSGSESSSIQFAMRPVISATVTGATHPASPIEITTFAAHGFATGAIVTITGVVGNTAANGTWTITYTGPTTFTLDGSTSNGAWVSGGTITGGGVLNSGPRMMMLDSSNIFILPPTVATTDSLYVGACISTPATTLLASNFTGLSAYALAPINASVNILCHGKTYARIIGAALADNYSNGSLLLATSALASQTASATTVCRAVFINPQTVPLAGTTRITSTSFAYFEVGRPSISGSNAGLIVDNLYAQYIRGGYTCTTTNVTVGLYSAILAVGGAAASQFLLPTAHWAGVSIKAQTLTLTNPATVNVSAATHPASPIEITTTAHGLTSGMTVVIAGVTGNTAANGTWVITYVSSTKFTLNGSTSNGAYTGGGTVTTALMTTGVIAQQHIEQLTVTHAVTISIGDLCGLYVAAAPTCGNLTFGAGYGLYGIRVGGATSMPSSAGLLYAAVSIPAHTLTITGATAVTSVGPAALSIGILALSNAAASCSDTAGLYVAGAPTGTFTRSYVAWFDSGTIRYDDTIALGGGAAPTLGTIGGSGPVGAAQVAWLRVYIGTTLSFIPYWQ